MLNTMEGIEDQTGSDETAWARWTRAWTAEENRHGDLLNKSADVLWWCWKAFREFWELVL